MGPEYEGSGETSTPLILHLEVERLLMQDRMAINPFCYHSDFSLHSHLALLLADPNQTTTDVNGTKRIIVHYKSKFDMQSSCKNIIIIIIVSCALMISCTVDVQLLPRVCVRLLAFQFSQPVVLPVLFELHLINACLMRSSRHVARGCFRRSMSTKLIQC